MRARHSRYGRLGDDRGVAATAIVLFPMFATVVFMFAQGAMWQNDRQAAAAAADHASQAVALHGGSSGEAQAEAARMMRAAGLRNVNVSISRGGDATIVEVSGTAPGLITGTSITVSARSVAPTEGLDGP